MKFYKKEGSTAQIIAFPDEEVERGDYLLVEDQAGGRGLIVQVIDVQFVNLPGVLEDLLRDTMTAGSVEGEDEDPLGVSSQVAYLKDARLLVCKIRGAIDGDGLVAHAPWLPSRIGSSVRKLSVEDLICQGAPKRPIRLGRTKSGKGLVIDAKGLDGRLSIIMGRKGTGKSHLSKLLFLNLTRYGAPSLVFDINGEYVNLGRDWDGRPNEFDGRIMVLKPGVQKFGIKGIGLRTAMDILLHALDLPPTSGKVFASMWKELALRDALSLSSIGTAIQCWNCHESVREALASRYHALVESGIFEDGEGGMDFGEIAKWLGDGNSIVVNMRNRSSLTRRILVELFLGKLTELLSSHALRAIFLFAEEAHLYLGNTYWDDVVTRMRHLGIFATFITNQPDTIREGIYRQADNIFLFNFANDHDLDFVSKTAKLDADSVKLLVSGLPERYCLSIGEAVRNFPLVFEVEELSADTLGQTRYFFND
jgi:DNA helicase HerA-like ATPase